MGSADARDALGGGGGEGGPLKDAVEAYKAACRPAISSAAAQAANQCAPPNHASNNGAATPAAAAANASVGRKTFAGEAVA